MAKLIYSHDIDVDMKDKLSLRSLNIGKTTTNSIIHEFERSLANYCWADYGVAVNSATSALHIACLALDVGEGDVVWTSPLSFVASANCALYCGASVDFVDIDPNSYNLSIKALEEKLKVAKRNDCLPKALIPVHLSGQACDMRNIRRLADQYGFSVIEDASHAIGARYRNEPVGCCHYSDITVFSFHPLKDVANIQGGMAMTNSQRLAQRMQLLRCHGITDDADQLMAMSKDVRRFAQIELGYNYQIADTQAQMGLDCIEQIDSSTQRRHEIATIYDQQLADLPLQLPVRSIESYSASYLYIVQLNSQQTAVKQRQVIEHLSDKNINVSAQYGPIHTQPYFLELGFTPGQFPAAEHHDAQALSLPIYSNMTDEQQSQVCDALMEALQQ